MDLLLVIILGVLGVLCVGAEVFLPGGVLGLIGGAAMLAALFFAHKAYDTIGILIALVSMVVAAFALYNVALKLAPKTRLGRSLFLSDTQKGVNVSLGDMEKLVDKEGTALSELRPAGIANINGKRYNVTTQGDFIEQNSKIKIIAFKNNQLIVEKVS